MPDQHPITPPPELVEQWIEADHWEGTYEMDIATKAARWGADQELEACVEWLVNALHDREMGAELRAALAEQPVGPPMPMPGDAEGLAEVFWGRYDQPEPEPVAPTPIPVAERLPEFSDCDPEERVWAWNPFLDHWKLSRINRSVHTHWLPANALPVPANG
jgi:hypothetical protein